MKSPFRTKKYDSYDKYLEHQCSKLNLKLATPTGRAWLARHEKNYAYILKTILNAAVEKCEVKFSGKTCLCVGARGEAEVGEFINLGCLSMGIDLNPTPDNQYVVTGDVCRIQYPENSFDFVYTNALDHFLLIDEAIKNIRRVLKPNGLFLLVVGTPDGAKEDEYGSTYWNDCKSLVKYIKEFHRFKPKYSIDVRRFTGNWFSHFVVLQKVVK
jgi:SAM-dependent methyltransferase